VTLEAAQTIPTYDADGRCPTAPRAIGDLDGNGHPDLAIGVPGHDIGAIYDAGAVNVLYGGASGPGTGGTALWTRDSPGVVGKPDYQDDFGAPLAIGDFDGNGYGDLGIGVVGDMIGGHWVAGAVNVLYGSPTGLSATGNQLWHQDVPGVPAGPATGWCCTGRGDLDGDGRAAWRSARPGTHAWWAR
jgi:hypothetical protein